MNYQHLIYFKTIAEMQHFTKAADALFITQPALSKAIKALEAELGAPLFEKTGRNITLTKYGELFLTYVKKSLHEVDAGITAVRNLIDQDSNIIKISALHSMYSFFLPEKMLQFQSAMPNCRFICDYNYTTTILDHLLNGSCDLGICSNFEATEQYKILTYHTLYREPLCFVVRKDHPLTKKASLSVTDLACYDFIVYLKSRWGINTVIFDLCQKAGFQPHIFAEGYNDFGVINLVASSNGIALIPASGYLRTDTVVPIEVCCDIPLYRSINLTWRTDTVLPHLVTEFRNLLIQSTQETFEKTA